ncbi:MAG TPA: DUF4410 domain-containing protein [Kiloniellaceae bacterium]|nr:DUF4410 domain-containing protein [Kiloniellaceae bacterium]
MKSVRVAIALLSLLALAACASTEVTDRQSYEGPQLARPDHIIVYDFTANPDNIPGGSALQANAGPAPTAAQLQEIDKLGAEVARQLVAKLSAAGLPAVRASEMPSAKVNDIEIRGYFVAVDQGSATKRVLVGFGAGDAELMTVVEGYRMTANGLQQLGRGEIKSDGGKIPGLILPAAVLAATANPIGLVVGGAVKAAGEIDGSSTIEGSAERTADEIAKELEKAAERQGWL